MPLPRLDNAIALTRLSIKAAFAVVFFHIEFWRILHTIKVFQPFLLLIVPMSTSVVVLIVYVLILNSCAVCTLLTFSYIKFG